PIPPHCRPPRHPSPSHSRLISTHTTSRTALARLKLGCAARMCLSPREGYAMVTIRATLPMLAIAALLVGCANKQEQSSATQEPTASAHPGGQPTSAPAGHEEGQTEQVSTGGSPGDIMQRAHDEEKQLAEIITSAQLK